MLLSSFSLAIYHNTIQENTGNPPYLVNTVTNNFYHGSISSRPSGGQESCEAECNGDQGW
jgi:hypothetical protein